LAYPWVIRLKREGRLRSVHYDVTHLSSMS
jgi:hypothetical protein